MMSKYMGGRNTAEVIATAQELLAKGLCVSCSYLPVRKDTPEQVNEDLKEYKHLLDSMQKACMCCDVTLKPHQFGMYGSKQLALRNITAVVKHAKKRGSFVWIDMESHDITDATLEIFQKIYKKYKNCGICLQAYLKRSEDDMHELLKKRVPMRLVKGFYREHEFKNWKEVTQNYEKLMKYLLVHSKRPAIATHDKTLIDKAKPIIKKHKLKKAEFQFFKGACDDFAAQLAKEGFTVRLYIPYGHIYSFLWHGWSTFDVSRHMQRIFRAKTVV